MRKKSNIIKKDVEIIEPNMHEETEEKKYNVAAYARVSTDMEGQKDSFENQKRYYEEKIKSDARYNFVGVFADEAISGTTDKRPNFQRMIALAEQGYIDIIYTKSISRFSRNVKDLLNYCERLKKKKVNVIFEENSIDLLSPQGSFMLTILGAVAQMEVENTSMHINWTVQNKMKNGEYVGRPTPLGYDMVDNQLVVNEEEAKIVRYIFERYLAGMGASTISKELRNMGIKTKRGNSVWHNSTVIGIIKNEKYTGELLQGKTITLKTDEHKRIDNHGEGNMYRVKDNHEAIISLEDWQKAQEIANSRCIHYDNGHKRGTTQNTNQSIFTSRLVCGYCGKNYVRRTTHPGTQYQKIIWQCGTYCKQGKANCPKCKAVEEDYIKQSIVGMIQNLIDDTDSMFYLTDAKLNDLLAETDKKKDSLKEQIIQCHRNIELQRKKNSKILDMYLEELITEEDFEIKKEAIDNEIVSIQKGLDELNALYDAEETKKYTNKQISKLIKEGKAEGFNKELFDLLVNKITIGGRRSDGVDDPRSLHYELNDYNLNTDMSSSLVNGQRRYYSKHDMEEVKKNEKQVNNNSYSLNSVHTCRDGMFIVQT